MTDPKFNELPIDDEGDFADLPESSLTEEQKAARLRRKNLGLSINDTIARDANMSVGSRGVETSGVSSGSGAGAGTTSLTPGEEGESPAPKVIPGTGRTGTTAEGDSKK